MPDGGLLKLSELLNWIQYFNRPIRVGLGKHIKFNRPVYDEINMNKFENILTHQLTLIKIMIIHYILKKYFV